jgi:hypothetical protein
MNIMKRKSQCVEKSEKSSPKRFFATFSTDSKSASNFDIHIALKKFDHITLNANGDETAQKMRKKNVLIKYPTQAQRKQVEII